MNATTAAAPMIRASSISRSPGRGSLAKGQNRTSCELCADGRPVQAKSAFILYFEPFEYLRFGDRPFRQMRIERAGADILSFGQFCSRKFLASSSLANVSVALACVRFPRGSSNDTYHVPWDLLAIIPSRGLRRAAHRRGRNLNRRLTKSFRLPPASPN